MNSGEITFAIIMWGLGAVVGLWIFYLIIKGAIKVALRDHYEWVEQKESSRGEGTSAGDTPPRELA